MSLDALEHLRLLPLDVRATTLDPVRLPAFAGSTLRGAFGHALKGAACVVDHRRCEACRLVDDCSYTALFEPRPPAGARRLAGQPRVAAPYVLSPPAEAGERPAGAPLSFSVTLIGRAVLLLPVVAAAVLEVGAHGLTADRSRFAVDAILGPGGSEVLAGDPPHLARPEPVTPSWYTPPLAAGRARIEFSSPVRIVSGGSVARDLPFEVLVRALLWRASTLLEFHEGVDLDLDFKGTLEQARRVRVVESDLRRADSVRWSTRQERAMNLRGQRGHVDYEGDLEAFAPLLALGVAVGVGKGTTFGLGRMRVRSEALGA